MVPLHGPLHGVEELRAALVVPARLLVLVERDAGPVGQQAHGVDEIEVLHGPDEGDGVPRGLAAEAVVEALLGVHAERGRLLGVERAQPAPAPPHLLERGVLADQGDESVAARTWAISSSGIPTARRYRGALGAGSRRAGSAGLGPRRALACPGRAASTRARGQHGLGGGQPGHRDPEGRAAHVVEAGPVEEVDRRGVAAVLAADPHLEAGPGGPPPLGAEPDQLAHAARVDHLEGVARAAGRARGRRPSCGPRRRHGRTRRSSGSGRWCRSEKNSATSAISSARSAARGVSIIVPMLTSSAPCLASADLAARRDGRGAGSAFTVGHRLLDPAASQCHLGAGDGQRDHDLDDRVPAVGHALACRLHEGPHLHGVEARA